ncbi:hypothetical protein KSC_032380 [Ktedonobacter sp. SOSP1-52]|nr:hypothetical protein KSC_032380 [Ktedonobacter sp. SOSP1-52]
MEWYHKYDTEFCNLHSGHNGAGNNEKSLKTLARAIFSQTLAGGAGRSIVVIALNDRTRILG